MPNNINPYDPIWYAQTALAILEKSLGMAGRVYRGYDKTAQQPGSVIQIRKPGTFVATDAPATATDLAPTSVSVTLNKWREVKFALTDKELNFAGERIIEDHIRPAAVALADDIDQALIALWADIPWYYTIDLTASAGRSVNDIINARKILFQNKCPLSDLHFMCDGVLEAGFLGLSAFSQQQGAGDTGVSTQLRGTLGQKFGFEVFSNQNVPTVGARTIADLAGAAASGPALIGATTINVSGLTASAALKVGDIMIVTGHTQQYVVAADKTADTAGLATGLTFSPGLEAQVADTTVVTFFLSGGASAKAGTQNMAWNRNAFCLAMAPLTTIGNQLGARVESVVDPITGLALRSRMFYDGNASKVIVALDVLYGVKTLNQNMAVRAIGAPLT